MKNPLPLPLPEDLTERHVGVALQIIHALQPYILEPLREDPLRAKPELDGGVASSAAATFIKACNRLDAILDDTDRFNLKKLDELYGVAKRVWEGQAEFQEAQRDASRAIQRPSFIHKPPVLHLDDGSFLAYWGDLGKGEGVMGRGPTPQAAYEDFDAAWVRIAKDQLRLEPDPAPEPPPAPIRRPKKK